MPTPVRPLVHIKESTARTFLQSKQLSTKQIHGWKSCQHIPSKSSSWSLGRQQPSEMSNHTCAISARNRPFGTMSELVPKCPVTLRHQFSVFTLRFTLCSLTGRRCNQQGLGLSGLIHEKAHPVVPDIAQSRLECIDTGCIHRLLVQQIPPVNDLVKKIFGNIPSASGLTSLHV